MPEPVKAHVIFDEDSSLYLQSVANKICGSVTQAAHLLIKMAKESEITIDITLKKNTLQNNQGLSVMRFKKHPRFKMKF